jgi:hypothetical protein
VKIVGTILLDNTSDAIDSTEINGMARRNCHDPVAMMIAKQKISSFRAGRVRVMRYNGKPQRMFAPNQTTH